AEALLQLPLFDLAPPLRETLLVHLAPARLPDLQQVFQHMTDVARDGDIDMDYLVDRGRVDVDMRLLRARREIRDAAGDAVVEARPEVDHQVTAMHGKIGLVEP